MSNYRESGAATLANHLGQAVATETIQVNRIEWFGTSAVNVYLQYWPNPLASRDLGPFLVTLPETWNRSGDVSCYHPQAIQHMLSEFPYEELRQALE